MDDRASSPGQNRRGGITDRDIFEEEIMGYSKEFFNLLDQVNEFSEENNLTHGVWYRGQRNDWPLKSGLFRLYDDLEMVQFVERLKK